MQPQSVIGSLSSLIESKNPLNLQNCNQIDLGTVVVFNTESLFFYFKNKEYRDYVNNCKYISIDGSALALILRLIGKRFVRFHGPELMEFIMSSDKFDYKIIAGGTKSNQLLVRPGGANTFVDLPFTDDLSIIVSTLVRMLSKSQFSSNKVVLFISLGLPKQEIVSLRLLEVLKDYHVELRNKILLVPIGAAADFLNGEKKRAGIFWRRLGLEWLPRLIREPRMFPRILRSLFGIYFLIRQEIKFR
jgi:N-acetylglucosaminyldiphosphoundecaprenol N-acetyl-beta-D-mannosaminyltransferase